LVAKSRQMDHWHADETRWLVFVSLPDKSGHRWYLWAFQSDGRGGVRPRPRPRP
jgi:hypothetical protein